MTSFHLILALVFTTFLQDPVKGNDWDNCRLKSLLMPYIAYCDSLKPEDRVKCGESGWTRMQCKSEGCCYDGTLNSTGSSEKCFFPTLKNVKQARQNYESASGVYSRSVASIRSKRPTPNTRGDEIRSYYYDRIAFLYDLAGQTGHYNAPHHAAAELAERYPANTRSALRVLDVGAGTGLVGQKLHSLGFTYIDAVEPSPGMLWFLRSKNSQVYQNVFPVSFGYGQKADIQEGFYDVLVCVGALDANHIPIPAMDEMLRLVKPGGTIYIITAHTITNTEKKDYYASLEKQFKLFADNGRWKEINRSVIEECYLDGEKCNSYEFSLVK